MIIQNRELSIIIVSWQVKELLRNCLLSIFRTVKDIDYEVIVIDNNSHDRTYEMIQNEFPQVHLIKNRKNIGFAPACNQGLSRARGKYILFLNPDTVILEKAIENSLNQMKKDPQIGILGCKLLNPDLTLQPSCRRFPTLLSQVIVLLKLHRFFLNLKSIREYLMRDWPHNEVKEVDQVMGAFFLTKREVVEKVGSFDEKFKLWFEEVDYCQRLKNMGYKVIFFPEAKIIHHYAASFKKTLALRAQHLLNKSLLHYFKKYGSFLEYFIIIFLYPVSMLLALLVQIFIFIKVPFVSKKRGKPL